MALPLHCIIALSFLLACIDFVPFGLHTSWLLCVRAVVGHRAFVTKQRLIASLPTLNLPLILPFLPYTVPSRNLVPSFLPLAPAVVPFSFTPRSCTDRYLDVAFLLRPVPRLCNQTTFESCSTLLSIHLSFLSFTSILSFLPSDPLVAASRYCSVLCLA